MAETQIVLQAPSRILPGTIVYFPDGSSVVVGVDNRITVGASMISALLASGFMELAELGLPEPWNP